MKVILITGGTDGLGKNLAALFSKKNTVIIVSTNPKKIKTVCKELGCDGYVMDVRNENTIHTTVTKIIKKYKKIDCLINNAGVWVEGPLEKNDTEKIRTTVETNMLGTILVTTAVLPYMKENKGGNIININSQNGLTAKKERSVYTASKWAITGFTKSLQEELSKDSIYVTGLYPGKINTDLFKKSGVVKSMDDALDVKDVAECVSFILSRPKGVLIPELGIKSIFH